MPYQSPFIEALKKCSEALEGFDENPKSLSEALGGFGEALKVFIEALRPQEKP